MSISDLIGSSPQFIAALNEMKLLAPIDCPVLIGGERGHGQGGNYPGGPQYEPTPAGPICSAELRGDSPYRA